MNRPTLSGVLTGIMLLLCGATVAAQSSTPAIKSILICEAPSGQAVSYGTVAHPASGLCFQSDHNGKLRLEVSLGDTLLFKSLGYRDTTWVIDARLLEANPLKLVVSPANYTLKEVSVMAFYSYGAFRNRFANMPMMENTKATKYINMGINVKELSAQSKANSSSGMLFGLGFLYGKSDQVKYRQFIQTERSKERLYQLTSHENLEAFTGLRGETLDSFVVFLRTSYQLKESMNDYDLMLVVKEAFDKFLALQTPL